MRSMLPSSLLFLSYSLLSNALPLHPQALPPVAKRASYSVVAVDGSSGSAASSSLGTPASETTILQTQETTKTLTATASNRAPTTEVILSTVLLSVTQPAKTKTIDITEPAKTLAITVTKETVSAALPTVDIYSVVNPAGPSTPSSIISSHTSAISTCPACTTSELPPAPVIPFTTSSFSALTTTTSTTTMSTPEIPVPTMVLLPSSLSITIQATAVPPQPYNDGQWHTSYTAWNATTTAAPTGTALGIAWRAL